MILNYVCLFITTVDIKETNSSPGRVTLSQLGWVAIQARWPIRINPVN